MALFRKLFYRKPPDGLLEISERVYVFDCCFTTDAWEEENYKGYVGGVISQLRDHYPDASILVFNFREGESTSQIANALSEYDMTIMDYPRQYEGCPLLPMEVIHHFLRSSESWLSLGQQNVLLMHCERGGWPVLAVMLAALLIYRKQYSGEQKTLDMVYKQAPHELLHLLSPLNPLPSQLRYLQYVSRRNLVSQWPPLDRALTLDCIIIRMIPDFDGEGGCRPIFRIYGQDPFLVPDRTPKILFSTPKKSKSLRHYKQVECELVKIDINCHIQGDVVLECINLHDDMEREQMIFRAMFNTAFIRSNILMLNRDEIDILWYAKDQFPKDFRAEVLFSEMDAVASVVPVDLSCFEEKDGLAVEAFAKVQEIFSSVDWLVPNADAALNVLQQVTASSSLDVQEKLVAEPHRFLETSSIMKETVHKKLQEEEMIALLEKSITLTSKVESGSSHRSSLVTKVSEHTAEPQYLETKSASYTKQKQPLFAPFEPSFTVSAEKSNVSSPPSSSSQPYHPSKDGSIYPSVQMGPVKYPEESGEAKVGPSPSALETLPLKSIPSTSPIPSTLPPKDPLVGIRKPPSPPPMPPPPLTPPRMDKIGSRSRPPPPPPPPRLPSPDIVSLSDVMAPGTGVISASSAPLMHPSPTTHEKNDSAKRIRPPPSAADPGTSSTEYVAHKVGPSPTPAASERNDTARRIEPPSPPPAPPTTSSTEYGAHDVGPSPTPATPERNDNARPPPPPPAPLTTSTEHAAHKVGLCPTPPTPEKNDSVKRIGFPSPSPVPLSTVSAEFTASKIGMSPTPAMPERNDSAKRIGPPPPPEPPTTSSTDYAAHNSFPSPIPANLEKNDSAKIIRPPPPPVPPTTSSTEHTVCKILPPPPPPPPPLPFPSLTTTTSSLKEDSSLKSSLQPTPPPPALVLKESSTVVGGLDKNSASIGGSVPPLPPPIPTSKETSSFRGGPPPPPLPSGPAAVPKVPSAVPPPPPPHLHSRLAMVPNSSTVPPPPPPPMMATAEHAIPSAPPPPLPAKENLKLGVGPTNSISMVSDGASNLPGSPSPPPPSVPPPGGKGRPLLSRTMTSKSNQNKKLKPLHWLKLNRAVQGSLWAEAQKSGEASKAPEIDISELESLFSAAVPNSDQGGPGRKGNSRASLGQKSEKVQLVEHRRAYNCEIMLSKVKIPLPDLLSLVLALEDSAIDVDQVENLIKFCPTKEEMELLKGYKGEKDKLGKCEQFFFELMQVPRIESKLRVFSFKIQFHSQVSELRNNLNIVNSAADQIRNSAKLKRVMQTILSLGNALNQGTARGSAVGFRLDSLLKLTETRARNNKMTLMHYLCKVLADKLPELLDFFKDLSSIEPSSKIQLKYLAEEMQAISKGLEKIVQELSMSENDGPVSENFRKALKEFLCFAEGEVRALASLYSGVGRNVDALILYFGEDPSRCPFEQVISTLLNFVRMFNRGHEENCKQLEFERKKAEKEAAAAEKVKINASEKILSM